MEDNINLPRRYKGTKEISFIILFSLCLSVLVASSQSRDELINKGIDYVYKLKFDSSNAVFQSIINQNPKDPTGHFLIAMQEWWRINLNRDDESNDERYFKQVDKVLELCDERIDQNENDEWVLFLKGGTLGYRGFLNSLRESWLKAADDGREGLSLIQRSYELNPNNKDAVFGIGLYNYAADYVFESYPFLKTLMFFFPKGNKELGLSQLRDCAENAKFSKTEASFVLAFINLVYEKNYFESEKYSDKLFKQYPENPVFEKYLGRSYAGLGKWSESINIWKDILSKIDSNKFGYNKTHLKRETLYYLGVSYMRTFNYDESLNYYSQAYLMSLELDKDKVSPFQVFSALGIGMINDVKGNRTEALRYYDKVLEMRDVENSHETAKKFKENPYK
ncbi:MAG: tetratricopeptide repeat protein [Ignavibacteria bacterium]